VIYLSGSLMLSKDEKNSVDSDYTVSLLNKLSSKLQIKVLPTLQKDKTIPINIFNNNNLYTTTTQRT
jgi:hypothetical protein